MKEIEALIEDLQHADWRVRQAATEALEKIRGEEEVE
ncbi:MAG: HEAT repeat domain-containing protein [Candidatus Bipolaricaulia bacterium]